MSADIDRNRLIPAAVFGGLVAIGLIGGGALIGQGDGRYVAGGALAGAALGAASSSSNDDCSYYRGGRCYRNQGHWEREHGINSRDGYYNGRYERNNGRYYRDGRYWRNHGEWRSYQNRRDRDYRYDRRW